MTEHDGGARRHHKDLQLCRQVYDALTYALAELDDPMIDELSVTSVVPAPGAFRLLVTLQSNRDDLDVDAALERVRDAAAELREEVAAEVTRRKMPVLVFRVAHPDE